MNKHKHTPGPWYVEDDGETRTVVRAVEDGAFVAECNDGFYADTGEYIRAATVEANACLIAAAPELYEALAEFASLMERAGALHPTRNLREVIGDPAGLAMRARAALAKFDGKR